MIELLVFLRDNYPNAYRNFLQAAGYKVLDNQILKGDEVINIENLSIDKQKDLSGRLLRMWAKGTDILHRLQGNGAPVPEEASNEFNRLLNPIVNQWEFQRHRDILEKGFKEENLVINDDLAEWIINNAASINDDTKEFICERLKMRIHNNLSFDKYNRLLELFNKDLTIQDLDYYIETETAFNLLVDRISKSTELIKEIDPDAVVFLLNKSESLLNHLLDSHKEFEWHEIEWLVPSLLQSEQFEMLARFLNRTQDGWKQCLNMPNFNALIPFISYWKEHSRENSFINFTNGHRREEYLRWMIENETDFRRRQSIIEFFFEKASDSVSMELFTYLFNRNFFFKCILTRFDHCLNKFTDNDIADMMAHARKSQAWEKAQGIMRKHLVQQ